MPPGCSLAGFYALPEVGERVLVQFLGQWDSDAVVLGSVRYGAVTPKDNARDTKRWRTPSGNEIALTTQGEEPEAKDVVRILAHDRVILEAQVEGKNENVFLMCGKNYVHLINKEGQAHVEVRSAGTLLLHADGHLQIEGQSVQIKAPSVQTAGVSSTAHPAPATGQHSVKRRPAVKGKSRTAAARDKKHRGLYRTMHGSVAGSPTHRGINREAYARAIAQEESGGNYQERGIFVPKGRGYALGAYQFMSYRSDVEQIVRQKPGGAEFLARCTQGIKPTPDEVTQFFTPEEQEQLFSEDSLNLIDHAARQIDPTTGQLFTGERLVERAAQMHFSGAGGAIDGHGRDGNNTSILQYGQIVSRFYNNALSGR